MWSSEIEESRIANHAFNCKWETTDGWTWKKNGEKDCVGWLMNIYFGPDYVNNTVEYNGACDPKNGALQNDEGYFDSQSTTESTSTTERVPKPRLLYVEDLDLLEDILTVMTSEAMKVDVEMELVSLNAMELADSSMDTTIVVFSSWTGRTNTYFINQS